MKKRRHSLGSWIRAVLINMVLQFEWLLLALLLLVLHYWINIPIIVFWAALGFWVLLAMIITWFVTWASECSDTNPGPGAKRTSERLKNKSN